MTPQEKELISTLLTRLQAASTQVKDPEADAMIRQALMQQPDAPYYLVQTVLIQDLSLHNAQSRIAELEGQLSQAKLAPPAPASTSFLGSLFGHRDPPPQVAGTVPPSGPWNRGPQTVPPQQTYAPQPGYPPQGYGQPGYGQPSYGQAGGGMLGGGGGGFLRSAAATAAGVAGGALLFEGIQSMFGHGYANSLGGAQAGMTPGLGETVINNYYGDSGGQDGAGASGGQDYSGGDFGGGDAGYDSASDNSGGDFGGGDSGGGDFGGGDFGGGDSGGSSSC